VYFAGVPQLKGGGVVVRNVCTAPVAPYRGRCRFRMIAGVGEFAVITPMRRSALASSILPSQPRAKLCAPNYRAPPAPPWPWLIPGWVPLSAFRRDRITPRPSHSNALVR